MIRTESLTYEYDTFDTEGHKSGTLRALEDVDLTVKPGQFVTILGRNGSGKSTLAKQMNALLLPTAGTVWVDGKDTRNEEDIWAIRQSAGMVFQNPDNQIVGTVVEDTAMEMIDKMIDDESEIISIYFGDEVDEEIANDFAANVEKKYPDLSVELHSGGQPIYYYIVSVE